MPTPPKTPYPEDLEKAKKLVDELREKGIPEDELEDIVRKEVPNAAVLSHLFKKSGKAFKTAGDDEGVQSTMMGPQGRGAGYLERQKDLIRKIFSTNAYLIEFTNDLGLTVLLAALSKVGLPAEHFRQLLDGKGDMREAFKKAGDLCFNAIDKYGTDITMELQLERDTARGQLLVMEQLLNRAIRSMDPITRLENVVTNMILTSGTTDIDPQALSTLIDKYVGMLVENEARKAIELVVPR